MADQSTEKPEAVAPAEGQGSPAVESKNEQQEASANEGAKTEDSKDEVAEKSTEPTDAPAAEDKKDGETEEKPAVEGDTDMPDATEEPSAEGDQSTADVGNKTPANKNSNRRKSGGAASNRKSLNKKASKAKMTHLDAQPGDHFLVKLKGFPEWPAIICDESMLPQALLTTRPVTAAKPDGTYAEAYAEGGKRAYDRNYPVMYLSTNEFGWVVNTALTELPADKAQKALEGKVRKDLKAAFELAVEQHPIDYYKDVLQKFEEEMQAKQEAAAAAAATPKKSKKKATSEDADDDVDMADVEASTKSKSKKRKAEEDAATPQRSDSAKKPKIKLNTSSTSKNANGNTPQAKDASKAKPAKAKKNGEKKEATKEKLNPKERLERKNKEVLYLRYKLQRGLLSKESPPKEEDMKQMSDFVTMLENFPDLEVSIIRDTRINKVLKQVLKLPSIPRESEFNFKSRSQALLDKWNKVMATDGTPTEANAAANGVNGTSEPPADQKDGEAEVDKDEKSPEDKKETEKTEKSSEEPIKTDAPEEAEAKEKEPAEKVTEPATAEVAA